MRMNKTTILFIAVLILITAAAGYQQIKKSKNQAVTKFSDIFDLNIYSDKQNYLASEKIKIWATLEYRGGEDRIEIWHGIPYIIFEISDGDKIKIQGLTNTVLVHTILDKNRVYSFNYEKSGGYSKDDKNAEFYNIFYKEKDLILPKGVYKVKVMGAFSLNKNQNTDGNDLVKELEIKVE